MNEHAQQPIYIQAYEEAKRFWDFWVNEPNSDSMFVPRNGFDVIAPTLVTRYDQHPIRRDIPQD